MIYSYSQFGFTRQTPSATPTPTGRSETRAPSDASQISQLKAELLASGTALAAVRASLSNAEQLNRNLAAQIAAVQRQLAAAQAAKAEADAARLRAEQGRATAEQGRTQAENSARTLRTNLTQAEGALAGAQTQLADATRALDAQRQATEAAQRAALVAQEEAARQQAAAEEQRRAVEERLALSQTNADQKLGQAMTQVQELERAQQKAEDAFKRLQAQATEDARIAAEAAAAELQKVRDVCAADLGAAREAQSQCDALLAEARQRQGTGTTSAKSEAAPAISPVMALVGGVIAGFAVARSAK